MRVDDSPQPPLLPGQTGGKELLLLFSVHQVSLREKCPYSEFFGPYFPAFGLNTRDTKFSPNAGKYGPEKLRTLTRFTLFLFSNWIILKGK